MFHESEPQGESTETSVQVQGCNNPTNQQGTRDSCEIVQLEENMTHSNVGEGLRPTCEHAMSTSPQVPSFQQVQIDSEPCHELETTGSAPDLRRGSEAQNTVPISRCGAIGSRHVNKTFEEAHADLGYVRQMWSRRAVSAWVRSFQMYCRARSQITSAYTSTSSTTWGSM